MIGSWAPALAVAALAAFALAPFLPNLSGAQVGVPDFRWVTYANTALAGSTAIYLAHLWHRSPHVGRAATALAALGALGIPLGLALDASASVALPEPRPAIGLYEGTALFSAVAVLAYLAMERIYRSREMAVVVMPVVMLAVLCEIWLVAQGVAAPGRPAPELSAYWKAGHRFAVCLGYLALAAGAARGTRVLVGARVSDRQDDAPQGGAIIGAAAVGVLLLLIGTAMGLVWSFTEAREFRRAIVSLMAPALLAAFALLAWARVRRPSIRVLAWCALAAFLASTAGLLSSGWLADPVC